MDDHLIIWMIANWNGRSEMVDLRCALWDGVFKTMIDLNVTEKIWDEWSGMEYLRCVIANWDGRSDTDDWSQMDHWSEMDSGSEMDGWFEMDDLRCRIWNRGSKTKMMIDLRWRIWHKRSEGVDQDLEWSELQDLRWTISSSDSFEFLSIAVASFFEILFAREWGDTCLLSLPIGKPSPVPIYPFPTTPLILPDSLLLFPPFLVPRIPISSGGTSSS